MEEHIWLSWHRRVPNNNSRLQRGYLWKRAISLSWPRIEISSNRAANGASEKSASTIFSFSKCTQWGWLFLFFTVVSGGWVGCSEPYQVSMWVLISPGFTAERVLTVDETPQQNNQDKNHQTRYWEEKRKEAHQSVLNVLSMFMLTTIHQLLY